MFLEDMIGLLVTANVGVYGTSIFQSANAKVPDGSAAFLLLIEYGGSPPQTMHRSQSGGVIQVPAYVFPTAQCTARGKSRSAAQALSIAAWNVFSKNPATQTQWQNQIIGSSYYVWMKVFQQPTMDLGLDPVGLQKYGFNFGAMKRP